MCEKFNKQQAELRLLCAKDAVFKMIMQFNCPTTLRDDGELYVYNYCESALEAAFSVLDIEENYIPLWDFCQMWEDNDRAFWAIKFPDEPFNGITADIHYKIMKEEYESRQRWFDMMDTCTLVRPKCIDWEALYINGKLVDEGHSLSADRVLECIAKPLDCKVELVKIRDEVAEMGMPTLLSDLEVENG
jgi:hypothetical protein